LSKLKSRFHLQPRPHYDVTTAVAHSQRVQDPSQWSLTSVPIDLVLEFALYLETQALV
jgi:hypothetical protein